MIALAPGKLVLSGAYAVLSGAPAIVAAASRYVTADSGRAADRVTAEVGAAIAEGTLERAPWFDASPLRVALPDGTSRKLGLGSSAAILVASLAAARGASTSLRDAVFPLALRAHRKAQPGGSGVDVAASTYGGVLEVRLDLSSADHALSVAPHPLPEGLVIEVFASAVSAETARFLELVRALEARDRALYRRLIEAASEGSRAALAASTPGDFYRAIDAQVTALAALGEASGAAIVTGEVAALRPIAADEGAVFGPSGAGGGDIALYMGPGASSARFRERALAEGLSRLDVSLGAEGVHLVGGAPPG